MLPNADPVRKASIVARGMMGGYTRVVPDEDRMFKTKRQFEDELAAVFMAGHVAESMVCSTSSRLEPPTISPSGPPPRAGGVTSWRAIASPARRTSWSSSAARLKEQRNYSDEVAFEIDKEIRMLVDCGLERAKEVVTSHFAQLEAIAELLMREETIEGEELEAPFDSPRPKPTLVGPPGASPAASLITPAEDKKPRTKRNDSDDRDRPLRASVDRWCRSPQGSRPQ
ncbi:MAG: hypothetical protein R2855_10720 [Thermomicrobiales bacterium]